MKNATVKPIPEGYHTLTTFIAAAGAAHLIDFLKKSFDAKENSIHKTPDGTILHAELLIGDSRLMLSDATTQFPALPAMIYMYTEDVDAVYEKAMAAGGVSLREPTDEFYGDRSAGIKDPSGNQWWMATHIEDVSPEEMKRREEERSKQQRQAQ
ncbi:MAG: VOC family protein [Chitinophagales bacterium]